MSKHKRETEFCDLYVKIKYAIESSDYCKRMRESDDVPAFGLTLCNKCIDKKCKFLNIYFGLQEMNKRKFEKENENDDKNL